MQALLLLLLLLLVPEQQHLRNTALCCPVLRRSSKIALNYMKGWFIIDVGSSLPISYVTYMFPEQDKVVGGDGAGAGADLTADEDTKDGSSNLRAMKVRTHHPQQFPRPSPCQLLSLKSRN